MEIAYRPHLKHEFESLIERIHPPMVCIDNETCIDSTVIKVDSANKPGILLEMVQLLTDLDLLISKSYVSSDGGWLMDVFHVTDQLGNKITDQSLLLYIKQALPACARGLSYDLRTCPGKMRWRIDTSECTALEMTGMDHLGLMSEVLAVLVELGCHVTASVAWTHSSRKACIMYLEDAHTGHAITDLNKLAHVRGQIGSVVAAHHSHGERWSVRLATPGVTHTHPERRLHQLLAADEDYMDCRHGSNHGTEVTIDHCKESWYSMVTVRCRDRPKLLFDTICVLTDMQYMVFHASIISEDSVAFQEYYVRRVDGCTLDSVSERRKLKQCLIAAIERRFSHGLRLDICNQNRTGCFYEILRAFRESGLAIAMVEMWSHNGRAMGSFYVKDTSGEDASLKAIEMVRREIGGILQVVNKSSGSECASPNSARSMGSRRGSEEDARPRFSLRTMLWSQLERLSSNFKPTKY